MSTLRNFGVPLGNTAGRGGILMPKIKNRFRVIVTDFGYHVCIALTQQVVTVARPNVNFNPQTIHSYNSISYYAGKAEWETLALTVRDDVTNSVSRLVGAQMQKQMNFFEQTVPMAAQDYKFGMKVECLDGGNDVVLEQWVAEGCFLATTNYQTFDYSSADAMTIELVIRCDNFTLSNPDTMPINPEMTYVDSPFAT